MKKIFMACALILSLCILGGCSKDDEPGSGSSKVNGNIKINGKTIDLKYGYLMYDEEFYFFDKDVFKYVDDPEDIPNIEYSGMIVECDIVGSSIIPEFVCVSYKVNDFKETGTEYYCEVEDLDGNYFNFSYNNGKVSCSAKSLPMEGYDYKTEKFIGNFNASISLNGSVRDLTEWAEDFEDYSTRGIEIIQVSDSKQIQILRSLMPKSKRSVK